MFLRSILVRLHPPWSCHVHRAGRYITTQIPPKKRPKNVQIDGVEYPADEWTNVTPTILSKIPLRLHLQPNHPLGILRSLIEAEFPSYAFLNSLSPIVSTHQNFDELGFPPGHPGRSVTDSYYLNQNTVLRTHTSAHEIDTFRQGHEKWLLTADVYRRDEIDASHSPVFHQVEGARTFSVSRSEMDALKEENEALRTRLASTNILIEDDTKISPTNPWQNTHHPAHAELVAANLKHHLNALIYSLFSSGRKDAEPLRVRWIEAYFPFTSPSYEVEVFFQGKWLEILGCGVVKQRTLDLAGVPNRISWAFGLGLERIAMVLFSIPDIRLFWSTDRRFLGQFKPGKISSFQPYSRFPPCHKDVSFWTAGKERERIHDNDFCDVVRDVAGSLVEDVKLIDEFVHPKTGRTSVCYRINYRSMDRSLSNDEVNAIQTLVTAALVDKFQVEIR